MSARAGDASAEEQLPVLGEQERVPGGFRAESAGFRAVDIEYYRHPGNGLSTLTQARIVPVAASIPWRNEKHISGDLALEPRHDLGQLADAGSRAWAARMSQHDQRGTVGCRNDTRLGPRMRQGADAPRSVLV